MRHPVPLAIALVFSLICLVACGAQTEKSGVKLMGRAVLPADTFIPGPAVGMALEREINGCKLPFESLPVQGISSLIPLGEDKYLALQDNGFGTKKNSPDYPLGWFVINLHWGIASADQGEVNILQRVALSDPDYFFPFPLTQDNDDRHFTGADLDPESFVRLPDGTLWVGDEFGPWLLHFSAEGNLLSPPVELPTPDALLPLTNGATILRSPDNPEIIAGDTSDFQLPRSGGLEGLALSPDGKLLFVAVEKQLVQDDQPTRRLIMEFDLDQAEFTSNTRYYQAHGADISLAALETWSENELLVTERDGGQGQDAKIKRIFRVQLNSTTENGYLKKELVCDLLDIQDESGLTQAETGALGLGAKFTFPFVTPEVLVKIDEYHILVANDNNYPMSCGRRPAGIADDSEFILLELP